MKLSLLFVNFDRTNGLELSAYLDIQSFNVLKIHSRGKKVCKIGVYGSFCIQMFQFPSSLAMTCIKIPILVSCIAY